MDRLENEIKTVKDRLNQIEPVLVMCYGDVKDVDRNQEQIEHRLSVNKESSEGLEKRIAVLEEYVGIIYKYVNDAIVRVNTLHECLKELTYKDLQCHETLKDSDDEFDLDNMDEKIETK